MAVAVEKISALLLAAIGIIVIALSIAGIYHAQYIFAMHLFVVILVLSVFAFVVVLFAYCAHKKSKNDYDVNDGSKASKTRGKVNKAYINEDGKSGAPASNGVGGGSKEKWVNNYVPYGEYPAGSAAAGSAGTNNVAIVDETQTQQNGETKWKKNYVAYQEEEDSNRRAAD